MSRSTAAPVSDVGSAAVGLLSELVAIDPVNPGLVPGAVGETRVVEHLQARLDGHVDTVGVIGMPQPFVARVEGDRPFGRCTADMQGGVAGLVIAAEALPASGARVRPVLALVAEKEDASHGSASVIQALRRAAPRHRDADDREVALLHACHWCPASTPTPSRGRADAAAPGRPAPRR